MYLKLAILSLLQATFFQNTETTIVSCYYESWLFEKFAPEDIDVSICTHINYAFLGIHPNGTFRLDGSEDILKRLGALKSLNPDLKLLISVGGWAEGSTTFSEVAADADKKKTAAESALYYMQTYDFDGIDLDWEYPGERGGTPADKENFIDMLTVIREVFDQNGGGLVTAAVWAIPQKSSYNVNSLSKIVDYINVMTYDLHSSADNKTGENSPLYPSSSDSDWERENTNCDASINNWLNSGADPTKLVLGLGFYGKTYELADPGEHTVGAPTVGPGVGGGGLGYPEICQLTDWTEAWDDEQQVPYKYKGNQWVQYAKERNLGGVMMWAVDIDDKDGVCGEKNPLLNAIKNNL
ncbi:chitinase-like protein 3 isoform X2 [Tribolium castaneum]|uniref:chitinase-like protein 3 isoform X2 n=1 Tax=Tribolium castaneum TaxID=7070 RepID=UPI00077D9BF0|nr:PREDICTED: chitinase-like protein 3 isoform X2 [Tribolium castaneum]|eukprot:XP_015836951.1 PREDICTED: chitinase-like protein 3 isoform X2 [Tribolium castaneum]